jgi:hypothetical protein
VACLELTAGTLLGNLVYVGQQTALHVFPSLSHAQCVVVASTYLISVVIPEMIVVPCNTYHMLLLMYTTTSIVNHIMVVSLGVKVENRLAIVASDKPEICSRCLTTGPPLLPHMASLAFTSLCCMATTILSQLLMTPFVLFAHEVIRRTPWS